MKTMPTTTVRRNERIIAWLRRIQGQTRTGDRRNPRHAERGERTSRAVLAIPMIRLWREESRERALLVPLQNGGNGQHLKPYNHERSRSYLQ
jgi:hypothetical protein